MGLLAFLLRASRGVVVLSVVAGLACGASGVALIALVPIALGQRMGTTTQVLGLVFLGLCLVAALSRVVAQATMSRLAQGTVCTLCLTLCRRLLAVPLRTFESLDPGGVLAVLTEDIVIVANTLAGLPSLCINLPIVVVCLAYVGWLSPVVLAEGIVFGAVAMLVNNRLANQAMRQFTLAREAQDTLVADFRGMMSGFRELRQHVGRREAFLAEGLQPAAETVRDRSIAGMTQFAMSGGWSQASYFGFIGLLLFVLSGVHHLDREVLEGVVLVILFLMSPLDVVLTWLPMIGRAQVSLRRIEALGLTLPEEADVVGSPSLAVAPPFDSEIVLEGVTYAYDQDGFVLGPINLTLGRGELVFVSGGNGSGKTTVVKLIAGLYTPGSGTIQLDGRPVTAAMWEAYRQLFSVVFVDGHLFPTLRGLDRPDLDADAGAFLARLGLDTRVRVDAGAFSTIDLSQGQKKRLALLTAWLEDRPIVILDEWAANQDTAFKRFFYHELLPEWRRRGKTLLVITHDEDYFPVADRVIRLDAGRVREGEPRRMPAPSLAGVSGPLPAEAEYHL